MPVGTLQSLLQALLLLIFVDSTAIVAAILGPTYDDLLVPELRTGSLYPSVFATGSGPANYLAQASGFSAYTLATVVDPALTLLALAVALAYLSKPLVERWAGWFDGLLPRLVIAVVAANFTVPIAGALLSLGGSLYPVMAGWDGGAWQQWSNLAGWGEVSFSWDNGVVAFVLSIAEFAIVFALVLAIGLRDAMLAVLIVVLPIFTLLWPLRPLSPLARRAWFLFAELVFLPCVLVVPLELAVGSPDPVLLVAYLGCAVASPYLLSLAGTQLVAFGFPGAGNTLHGGVAQGVSLAPSAATAHVGPLAGAARSTGNAGRAIAGTVRAAGSASVPGAAPLAVAEALGQGALHLVRHVAQNAGRTSGPGGWGPVRDGGPR